MKFVLGLIAASVLMAQAAMACEGPQPPNCGCNPTTNQWVYNYTTNNTVNGVNGNVSSGSTSGATSGSTSSATGGNATGGNANATGGAVAGSGNSTNSNKNSNQSSASLNNSGNNSATATGGAGGKGGTGGAGGNATIGTGAVQNTNNVSGGNSTASISAGAVQNSVTNTSSAIGGTSSAKVGNVGASVGNVGASVGNVTSGASTSGATASGNGDGSNNTNITYEAPRTYRAPVSTAYSASLTSGIDTCLGSASAGAQTQILGLTFGKTYVDKNCILIKQTKLLRESGLDRSACKRMQMGKEGDLIKQAMQEAGEDCPPAVDYTPPPAPVAAAPVPADAVTHQELRVVEDRITTKVLSK